MLNLIIKSVFTLSYDSVKRLSRFVIIVFLIFYPHFRGLAKDQIHQFFIRSYLSHHNLSEWKHKKTLSTCRLWNYFRLIKCSSQPLQVTLIDSHYWTGILIWTTTTRFIYKCGPSNLPEDRFFLLTTDGTQAHVTFTFSEEHLSRNAGSWHFCLYMESFSIRIKFCFICVCASFVVQFPL